MNATTKKRDPDKVIVKVCSDSLFAGYRALPPAEHSTVDVVQLPGQTIDGREVLVTYERHCHRHYKTTVWSWRMTQAVLVDGNAPGNVG